jgi:hypothetical protein
MTLSDEPTRVELLTSLIGRTPRVWPASSSAGGTVRLDGRDLLGLGAEEEHVDAHHGDGEDEQDSDRRGDLAHDHAYRHASREG